MANKKEAEHEGFYKNFSTIDDLYKLLMAEKLKEYIELNPIIYSDSSKYEKFDADKIKNDDTIPEMLNREEIIEKFKQSNFVYARVDKPLPNPIDDKYTKIEIYFHYELNGVHNRIKIDLKDYENLVGISNYMTPKVKEIRKIIGDTYPIDQSNSFEILCNNFAFSATALRYDNNFENDISNIYVSSKNQKDFDESFFFKTERKTTVNKFGLKCVPISSFDKFNQKPKAKVFVKVKKSNSTLSEDKLQQNKIAIKNSNIKLNQNKEEAYKDFLKNGDIYSYLTKIEDLIHEHELYRRLLDSTPTYQYVFQDRFTQSDFVCGYLKEINNQYVLFDWFIISRPFRNFISMLKYIENFKKDYIRERTVSTVYKSSGYIKPMFPPDWKNFEIDIYDALSGNQNVICNTFRKVKLLENDYLRKKNYNAFWSRLKKKEDKENFIRDTFIKMFDQEILDPKYDEFYKKIFTESTTINFKKLIETYLKDVYKSTEYNLKLQSLIIRNELSEKIKLLDHDKQMEIMNIFEEYGACNETSINILLNNIDDETLQKILDSEKILESEYKSLNIIKNVYDNWWKELKKLMSDADKRKEILACTFCNIIIIEETLYYFHLSVQNHNRDVSINNQVLKDLKVNKYLDKKLVNDFISTKKMNYINIEGIDHDSFIPKRFIDEIALKHYSSNYLLFLSDTSNSEPRDIYRHLRTEKFNNDRCHDIVALILYVIYDKNIYFENDSNIISYEHMILYHDRYVHASWDIHNWLDKKLLNESMKKIKYKLSWDYAFYLE